MTTRPTIVVHDEDGDDLSVWPAIPGATNKPAIQIDHGKQHIAVEFTKSEAPALAAAILKAAEQSA